MSWTVPPEILVEGLDRSGRQVAGLTLGHGQDPAALLAAQGWSVVRALDLTSATGEGHTLTLRFEVEASDPRAEASHPVRRDPDLVLADGEVPEPHQRVAAYALVTSERGVLMTEFSALTNAPGQWGPPGGGIDPGEDPRAAVVRECWEESGQKVEPGELALVQTSHWVGRAPGGRVEDFHAVRLVFRATCAEPTEPVVHDVGGTTASAAWVPPDRLDRLGLTRGWRSILAEVDRTPAAG